MVATGSNSACFILEKNQTMFHYHFETVSMSDLLNMNMMLNCLDFERKYNSDKPTKNPQGASFFNQQQFLGVEYLFNMLGVADQVSSKPRDFEKNGAHACYGISNQSHGTFYCSPIPNPQSFLCRKNITVFHGAPRFVQVTPCPPWSLHPWVQRLDIRATWRLEGAELLYKSSG